SEGAAAPGGGGGFCSGGIVGPSPFRRLVISCRVRIRGFAAKAARLYATIFASLALPFGAVRMPFGRQSILWPPVRLHPGPQPSADRLFVLPGFLLQRRPQPRRHLEGNCRVEGHATHSKRKGRPRATGGTAPKSSNHIW